MPATRAIGNGSESVAKASATQRYTQTVPLGTSVELDPLQVIGMPTLFFWGRLTAGAIAPTVQLQFCVASSTGITTPTFEWLDYPGTFVLPVTLLPVIVPWSIPARFIRAVITAGAANASIDCLLSGTA